MLEARIQTFELAYRMQTEAAEAFVPLRGRKRDVLDVEDRPDAVVDYCLAQLLGIDAQVALAAVGDHPDLELRHLADLLFQGHLRDKAAHPPRSCSRQRRQRMKLRVEERLTVGGILSGAGRVLSRHERGQSRTEDRQQSQAHLQSIVEGTVRVAIGECRLPIGNRETEAAGRGNSRGLGHARTGSSARTVPAARPLSVLPDRSFLPE